jgi:DNA-binding PadR family transcriptional regulator
MTDAELTILSLLAQGPRFGHEIQQIIDERGLREWLAIGYSSVYYILNKFERQNMVVSELRTEGAGPARKLFTLTEAGRGILQTAVSDLLRKPRGLGTGFELGLANLHALKPPQVYQVLSHHQQDLRTQLEAVRASWARHHTEENNHNRDYVRALYTHSIALMEADLQWIGEFLDDWRTRYPGVEKDHANPSMLEQDSSSAGTSLHKQTAPDPLKVLQRLQRPVLPPKKTDSDD